MRSYALTFLILFFMAQAILCCPFGWNYDGTTSENQEICQSSSLYSRGVGYPWKFGDGLNLKKARRRCENDHPELGCEQTGAIIYPKCQEGYTNNECCQCYVVRCPSGYLYHKQTDNRFYCYKSQ